MKPQDIDKIANLVVGSLAAAPGVGILGCGAVSSTVAYDPINECTDVAPFVCDVNYECGGQAQFSCTGGFNCTPTVGNEFRCDEGTGFYCGLESFTCSPLERFTPTVQLPS
jgi:hypothetical protein